MIIAIIDDRETDRIRMFNCVSQYWKNKDPAGEPRIYSYLNGGSFLATLQYINYDLVLLDCNMDDMDGLQVAEKLRECDRKAVLVFVTVSRDYAVDGYRVGASDYLVKPFSYEDFVRAMEHIRPLLPSYREYITVPAVPNHMILYLDTIVFCDVDGHYVQYHRAGEPTLRLRMTFSQLQELLTPYPQFLLCYRGCMINMDYIRQMEEMNFLMLDESRVPFRKKGRKKLQQYYADYLFKKVRSDIK